MKVETHYSFSRCVVWLNKDEYIEDRKDVRSPSSSYLEHVRHGQVIKKGICATSDAPALIIEWLKELK